MFFDRSLHDLVERDVDAELDVLTSSGVPSGPSAATTKYGLEKVLQIRSAKMDFEIRRGRAERVRAWPRSARSKLPPVVSETVVLRSFVRVAKHVVGFTNFFETLFRRRIAWIDVRVILPGELAVRRLDLLLVGVPLDSEDFVVVFVL